MSTPLPPSPLSGLLTINKHSGVTSFWVVRQIRKKLAVKKTGHCGTLDPLATGVLLVVFGKATKLQSALMGKPKIYRAKLQLGITTDTGDITGTVKTTAPVPTLEPTAVTAVLQGFTGIIEQIPPMYSALKQNGVKLYELARQGIEVERKARTVTIYSIDLLSCNENSLDIRVHCSCGTYIRTLAEDIGAALGCGATVAELCREAVGEYTLDGALDSAEIPAMQYDALLARSVPFETLSAALSAAPEAPCA